MGGRTGASNTGGRGDSRSLSGEESVTNVVTVKDLHTLGCSSDGLFGECSAETRSFSHSPAGAA